MGDYIGDKKKGRSSSAGGDTVQFDAVGSRSRNSGSKQNQTKKSSPASGGQKKNSSGSGQAKKPSASDDTKVISYDSKSSKSGQQKSSSGSRSGQAKKPSASGQSGAKASSSQTKSGSGKASSSGAKQTRSQSGAKSSASGAKSGSGSKNSSAGKGAQTGRSSGGQTKKPASSAKSQSGKKNAYSDQLEKKRGSSYERELHASQRAADIKNARRRKTYNRYRGLFNFMFYAAIFVAVTSVIVIMSVTVLFGIENIVVEAGDDVPYTSAQIVSGCDIREGQNLFIAPISGAGEQIMTNLPYIETCSVERRLPSTVIIKVEGAKAVGVIIDENGQRVIMSSGMRVLENVVSAGDAPGVPEINGVVVSATSVGNVVSSKDISYVETAVEIVRIMDSQGLKLDSISFTAGGSITAVYDGRLNLIIGTASDLENKLLLAAMLINDGKITKHESGDLNLSIEGKATFTPDYVKQQHAPEESE